jgi:hypothetical protein
VIRDPIYGLNHLLLIYKICGIIILGLMPERILIPKRQISRSMLHTAQTEASCSQEQSDQQQVRSKVLAEEEIQPENKQEGNQVQRIQIMSWETSRILLVIYWGLSFDMDNSVGLDQTLSSILLHNLQVVSGWVAMVVQPLWEDVLLSRLPLLLLVDGCGRETRTDNRRPVHQLMTYLRTLLPRPILLMAVNYTLLVLELVLTISPVS